MRRVNQPFILFIHHMKQYYEALFFKIQTSDRMQYFTILKCKLHSFNIQNDRNTRGLLAKQYGQPIASCQGVWMNINRVTFQHNKELIMFLFLFSGFITICKLKKRSLLAAFWVLLQAMFMNDWKQTAQRLKLQERLLTMNKKIYFGETFTETTVFNHEDKFLSVSRNPES